MTKTTIWAATLLCAGAGACGGDATLDAGADASMTDDLGEDTGAFDADTDAGAVDLGPPDMNMGMMCDPILTTSTCAAGTYCAVVIYEPVPPSADPRLSYGECVPNWPIDLVEGSTCGAGPRDIPTRPGVRADPCGDGLYCSTAPTVSGVQRCHRMCNHMGADCNSGEYCSTENSAPIFFGTCTPTDDCDLLQQTGCHGSLACYPVAGTDRNLYSTCFAFAPPPGRTGAVGTTCAHIAECMPGTTCLPNRLPDGSPSTVFTCKAFCALDLDPDAGVPDGGAVGTCAAGTTCTSYAEIVPDSVVTFGAVGICF